MEFVYNSPLEKLESKSFIINEQTTLKFSSELELMGFLISNLNGKTLIDDVLLKIRKESRKSIVFVSYFTFQCDDILMKKVRKLGLAINTDIEEFGEIDSNTLKSLVYMIDSNLVQVIKKIAFEIWKDADYNKHINAALKASY